METAEVVEEEAVIDDLHLIHDGGAELEQEEEVGDEYGEKAYILTVRPEDLDKSKHKFRVPVTEIDELLYDSFCNLLLNKEVQKTTAKHREKLDCLFHSGDWAVGRCITDDLLGKIDPVMVHLPSKKFLIHHKDRLRLIKNAIEAYKNERSPIGAALQHILKTYIGFPGIAKLRNDLTEALRELYPAVAKDVPVSAPVRIVRKHGQAPILRRVVRHHKGGIDDLVKDESLGISAFSGEESEGPIDDALYDTVAEVIAGRQCSHSHLSDVEWNTVQRLVRSGNLVADYSETASDYMQRGWIIRERSSGRIVPRRADVPLLWRQIHDSMISTNSLAQIITFVEAKYVGVADANERDVSQSENVYKGQRVVFPERPSVMGSKPMQYVQIDLLGMQLVNYDNRVYAYMVVIYDLYSQFVFARAVESPQDELIMRFVQETFMQFGPPEAFCTYSNEYELYEAMDEMEKVFKTSIRQLGFGIPFACHRYLVSDSPRRAEDLLGVRSRWVETVAESVIDWNQRPNKALNGILSPFEVMFGRRPWQDSKIPQWISSAEGVGDNVRKQSEPSTSAEMNAIERHRFIMSNITHVVPRYDSTGRIVDPGTGILFHVGDRVYVRNLLYFETPGRRRPGQDQRYFRGIIGAVDPRHPHFLYRVFFYSEDVIDQDAQDTEYWPSLDDPADEGQFVEAWLSPSDVAPINFDQQFKRNAVRQAAADKLCNCSYEYCDLMKAAGCERGMATACCIKNEGGICGGHRRKKGGQQSKKDAVGASTSKGSTVEGTDDGQARFMYKNGELVRVSSLKEIVKAMDEEEEEEEEEEERKGTKRKGPDGRIHALKIARAVKMSRAQQRKSNVDESVK